MGAISNRELGEALSEPLGYYRDELAPGIGDLNEMLDGIDPEKSERFPYPEIHSEIRMAFSHIAGAFVALDDTGSADRVEELLRVAPESSFRDLRRRLDSYPRGSVSRERLDAEAKRSMSHLRRASLDARKAQYDAVAELLDSEFLLYRDQGIQHVDNGRFLERFEGLRLEAQKFYDGGKFAESVGRGPLAKGLYSQASSTIAEARGYLEECKDRLEEAASIRRTAWRKLIPSIAWFVAATLFALLTSGWW